VKTRDRASAVRPDGFWPGAYAATSRIGGGGAEVGENLIQLDALRAVLHAGLVGLLHPLATPVQVIALAGLALIVPRNKRNAAFASSAVEVAFAVGLAIGLGALEEGAGETPAADGLLAGATLCGLLAASGVRASAALALPVALISGIALGLDSPPDAVNMAEAVATLIGIACGAVVALALMASLAIRIGRPWRGVALRVAGSWIAAIAILALVVRWGGGL
jgi:urease accessory protein